MVGRITTITLSLFVMLGLASNVAGARENETSSHSVDSCKAVIMLHLQCHDAGGEGEGCQVIKQFFVDLAKDPASAKVPVGQTSLANTMVNCLSRDKQQIK